MVLLPGCGCCASSETCVHCVGACAYAIAITSPSQCAAQSDYLNCPYSGSGGYPKTTISLGWILGSVSGVQIYPHSWYTSGGDVVSDGFKSGTVKNDAFVGGRLFQASVFHEAYGANPGYTSPSQINENVYFGAHITVNHDLAIGCTSSGGGYYGGYISTLVQCVVQSYKPYQFFYNEKYVYSYTQTFTVPSQCVANTAMQCSGENPQGANLFRIIDAPFSVSTSPAGVTVTENLIVGQDGGVAYDQNHPGYGVAKQAVDSIKSVSSASFSVLSRASCNPLP